MTAPRFVLQEMGDYEACLAEAQRLYKRVKNARAGAEREAAQREYDRALQRARELGARLARELDAAVANAA